MMIFLAMRLGAGPIERLAGAAVKFFGWRVHAAALRPIRRTGIRVQRIVTRHARQTRMPRASDDAV